MRKHMGMAVLAIVSLGPVMAAEPGSLAGAFSATKPIFDARLRTEDVDQEGIANDANAINISARSEELKGADADVARRDAG